MSRFELIDAVIASSLQYGEDNGFSLVRWGRECWQIGLMSTALLLGVVDESKTFTPSWVVGPLCHAYDDAAMDEFIEYYCHPWLPIGYAIHPM
jgi:hypothetical protein